MHTQTPPMPHPQAQPARRLAGFTLMEVLVALGLFTLGFVAIAALLPAGALLQRETADDIQSRHLERNAEAIIVGTPIVKLTLLNAYHPGGVDTGATDLRAFDGTNAPALNTLWSLTDRSFAASITDPEQRTFYWLPLIRDTKNDTAVQDWEIVVFVLRRDSNVTYPGRPYPAITVDEPDSIPGLAKATLDATSGVNGNVFTLASSNDDLQRNDWIVDDQGDYYRILDIIGNDIAVDSIIDTSTATPTAIWYAPPGEDVDSGRLGRSPAVRVFKIPRDGKALNLN